MKNPPEMLLVIGGMSRSGASITKMTVNCHFNFLYADFILTGDLIAHGLLAND
jgi:hypothetical protein